MGFNNKRLTLPEFFQETMQEFPERTNEILSEEGLPYLQMGELAAYARDLFETGRREKLMQLINFIEGKIPFSDSELYNAIGVSFVENFVFCYNETQRLEIVKLLPQELTYMYHDLIPIFEKGK